VKIAVDDKKVFCLT